MDTQLSKDDSSTTLPDNIEPTKRMVQNFFLVWIDANIDESTADFHNSLNQLRSVVNDVRNFVQEDEAIDFFTDIQCISGFLVVTDTIGARIMPLIHDILWLDTIYILANDQYEHKEWAKKWAKIEGVHTNILSICNALELATKQCDQDSIPLSFVTVTEGVSNVNLNQLEPSFMYTQLFKEILFEMDDEETSIKVLTDYSRRFYKGNARDLRIIDEFERTYRSKSPIWWYTRECFAYRMLNHALRELAGDTIITMGFFMRDLHRQIQQLHSEQVKTYSGRPFTVYRGQGLSKTHFEKMTKTKGVLLSFNNFLSTSAKRDISLHFAEKAATKTDLIGVLFQVNVNPSVSSTPFASIRGCSYYNTEEEILFSMHTVFRVGEITPIESSDSLYQVDLNFTTDDDKELRTLTKRIKQDIVGTTAWERLGHLLIQISQLDKAEEIFNTTQLKTSSLDGAARHYNNFGRIHSDRGDYQKALSLYEKALEIQQKTLPANHPSLATSYCNMAGVYEAMGEYSKALSLYEKALEIQQKTLPANHPSLATSYSNMAGVYRHMGQYSKALSLYEKALEIEQKTLPENHPSLATSYCNMAGVYEEMGEYSKALSLYEKALEIQQKTLPANHPSLATSYCNMAGVYEEMGEYSKALSLYEKALEIQQKTLPANHPSLATSYCNMAGVYEAMGEYSKALSLYEKALEIQQKTLPENHPSLATSYSNMAGVYRHMGEYSKALSLYEKALEIQQKTLPANHPSLATSYCNMAGVYEEMGEYSKALSLYEKALEIKQKTLPANHPSLATSYCNMAGVYRHMGEYSKALSLYEKALEIQQKTLPENHPSLATSYSNMAGVYRHMGEYSKALSLYEKALEIKQKTLPANHPSLAATYNNIAVLYYETSFYVKSVSYFERARDIWRKSLPANHRNLVQLEKNIEAVKQNLLLV